MSGQLQRLVILGVGWGSYAVLKTASKKLFRIIVVSPRNHFLFTPLLASTTVGTLEFRSIIEPVRNHGFRRPHDFHLAEAVSWTPPTGLSGTGTTPGLTSKSGSGTSEASQLNLGRGKQEIVVRSMISPNSKPYVIPYDKLVIGVGALPNTFNVPGVHEYAHFLKEIQDARAIRQHILNNMELSMAPGISRAEHERLLHVVIVGGGPTGVEFGAELYDFINTDAARLYGSNKSDVRVTLVEANKILPSFDVRLQAYAAKKIQARANFTLRQGIVKSVQPDSVTLTDGVTLPCGLVVWSTGIAPRAFTEGLSVSKNKTGQILTDQHLRVLSDQSGNAYSLGDCADIEDLPLPCTAQVAERQGLYLAKLLNKSAQDSAASATIRHPPFSFRSMGMLAYVGDYQAVSDTPQLKLQGVVSWFLWRSAYLTRLGSWRLRMQVPLDWLKTLLFGRDTSRF